MKSHSAFGKTNLLIVLSKSTVVFFFITIPYLHKPEQQQTGLFLTALQILQFCFLRIQVFTTTKNKLRENKNVRKYSDSEGYDQLAVYEIKTLEFFLYRSQIFSL